MKRIFHSDFNDISSELDGIINDFSCTGIEMGQGERNIIKQFSINTIQINVKSFKVPNVINQIVYRFFRKGKAQRSFEFANVLLKNGIGTPKPIAYYEFPKLFLFKKSFYISEHLNYDLTFRELTRDLNYPEHDQILRAFTRFTHRLHEHKINFLDHSPGNTLIKKTDKSYQFFLVDLNRMAFGPMNMKMRVENFKKLTVHKSMIETMSDEYSKCSGEDYKTIFDLMWESTQKFQKKFHRKKRLKNKIKFWK